MGETSDRQEVKEWWAQRPMTYGATHGDPVYVDSAGRQEAFSFGTREFFEHVDETFYRWNRPLHRDGVPFGVMFPYAQYAGARVLEVGCGMGTMAMNWARQGARMTAVDLNPVAVAQTAQRFRLFGLDGLILQADGGGLPFQSESFDYGYSWGVLHHSPDLNGSIAELMRVLRPGAGFGVMLYNRASLRHWYLVRYIEGVLHAESRFLNELQLASRYSDGAREEGNPHTWPVTPREMRDLFARYSRSFRVSVFGDKELDGTLQVMMPGLWRMLPRVLKRPLAERVGWSVWITGEKSE